MFTIAQAMQTEMESVLGPTTPHTRARMTQSNQSPAQDEATQALIGCVISSDRRQSKKKPDHQRLGTFLQEVGARHIFSSHRLNEVKRRTVILTAQPRLFKPQRSGTNQQAMWPSGRQAANQVLYAPRDICMWPRHSTLLLVMAFGDLPAPLPLQRV